MDPKIKDLLNLQDYDIERLKVEAQLKGLPLNIQGIRGMIKDIMSTQEALKDEFKKMELNRKDLDRQLQESEEKVRKFKTQQIDVKKNEEYQALNEAIKREEENINNLADRQLELLSEMDEKQKEIKTVEEKNRGKIEGYETQIKHLEEQETTLKKQFQELQQSVDQASKNVDPIYLKKYLQVEKQVKRGPFVVALEGNRCHGCHLTVSNEVVSEVRHGGLPCQCVNCSRILYLA